MSPFAATAGIATDAIAAGHGVGAFNVITLEHAEAIVAGAEAAGRPVILQISENAVAYHFGAVALARAVSAGIVKVNIGTALNVVFTSAVRRCLAADERMTDPRRYLEPARASMATEVARLLELLTVNPAAGCVSPIPANGLSS